MADPIPVNGQITDAVTQSNVTVLGDAPAHALGTVYQALAHATGLAMQNAVAAQQQMNTVAQAATTMGVSLLYSVDTAGEGLVLHEDAADAPPAGAQ